MRRECRLKNERETAVNGFNKRSSPQPTKQTNTKTKLPSPKNQYTKNQIGKHTQRKRKPPPSHRKSNPRKLHPNRNHRKNNPQNPISPHQYSQKQSNAIKCLSCKRGRKIHGL